MEDESIKNTAPEDLSGSGNLNLQCNFGFMKGESSFRSYRSNS